MKEAQELLNMAKRIAGGSGVSFKAEKVGLDIHLHVMVEFKGLSTSKLALLLSKAEKEAKRRLEEVKGDSQRWTFDDSQEVIREWTTTKEGLWQVWEWEWGADEDISKDNIRYYLEQLSR